MNKLNQKLENGQYCDALFSDISNSLKEEGIFGISQSDLKKKENFEIESDDKMKFEIRKGEYFIKFEVYLDKNLKFKKFEISDRNGFDKKTKITLLIGNGLWRSLSEKELNEDKIGLDCIFKEFLEQSESLKKLFSLDNFHEEDFGKLDVICEICKQSLNR